MMKRFTNNSILYRHMYYCMTVTERSIMKSQDFQMMEWKFWKLTANQNEDFCQMLEDQSVVPCLCMSAFLSLVVPQQPMSMNNDI